MLALASTSRWHTAELCRGQVMKLIPGLNLCHECAKFFDLREGRIELRSEDDYELHDRPRIVTGREYSCPIGDAVNMQLACLCLGDPALFRGQRPTSIPTSWR